MRTLRVGELSYLPEVPQLVKSELGLGSSKPVFLINSSFSLGSYFTGDSKRMLGKALANTSSNLVYSPRHHLTSIYLFIDFIEHQLSWRGHGTGAVLAEESDWGKAKWLNSLIEVLAKPQDEPQTAGQDENDAVCLCLSVLTHKIIRIRVTVSIKWVSK